MGKHINKRHEILEDFTEEKYWELRKIWRTDQRIVDRALFCHIQTLAKWKQKNKVYSQPYNVGNSRRKKTCHGLQAIEIGSQKPTH